MLRHGAFLAFVMGFQTFEISPKGIRDCFRARPGVIGQKDTEYRRNQSNKVLVTVGRRKGFSLHQRYCQRGRRV